MIECMQIGGYFLFPETHMTKINKAAKRNHQLGHACSHINSQNINNKEPRT